MSATSELVEQAMMSGYSMINAHHQRAIAYYEEHPDCSGADMLRAALNGYASEFVEIRQDLVDDVIKELREQIAKDVEAVIDTSPWYVRLRYGLLEAVKIIRGGDQR